MGIYDQIKKAFQDVVAPEIRALQGEVKRLDEKIDAMHREVVVRFEALDMKITSEIRRLDARLDGLERELKIAVEVRERLAVLETKLTSR